MIPRLMRSVVFQSDALFFSSDYLKVVLTNNISRDLKYKWFSELEIHLCNNKTWKCLQSVWKSPKFIQKIGRIHTNIINMYCKNPFYGIIIIIQHKLLFKCLGAVSFFQEINTQGGITLIKSDRLSIILQKIYIQNKWCSSELSIQIIFYKKKKKVFHKKAALCFQHW